MPPHRALRADGPMGLSRRAAALAKFHLDCLSLLDQESDAPNHHVRYSFGALLAAIKAFLEHDE